MKTRINLILAESSLELVPRELWSHPAVWRNARRRGKKPGETLLEVSLHYPAMRRLAAREKRGRPDIVFVSLLEALGSPANAEGMLRVYVHTINDLVLYVDSKVRIPRDYRRFVGLMEQLLVEGRVPPGSDRPLLYVKNRTIRALIKEIRPEVTMVLWEKGERRSVVEVARRLRGKSIAVIVGGFPHGDFDSETLELADIKVSIYPVPLETWCVVSRVISAFEHVEGVI